MLKSYCTCSANQALLWMALFRVNGYFSQKPIALTELENFLAWRCPARGPGWWLCTGHCCTWAGNILRWDLAWKNLALPDLCLGLHIFPGSLPRSISKEQRPSSQTGSFSINVSTGETGSYHHQTLTLFSYLLKTMLRHQKLEQQDIKVKSALETVWPSPVFKWRLALLISLT